MEKPTLRYDENKNAIWTYKGVDIYEWLYGSYTSPGGLNSFFTIGPKPGSKPFRTKELVISQIDSGLQ